MSGGLGTIPSGRLPEKPVIPQRPTDFDATQALDPETSSGKYNMAMFDYTEKKVVYDEAQEQQAAVNTRRNAEKARVTALRDSLVNAGGVTTVVEADDVLRVMNSAAARDPVNIMKYHRMLTADPQALKANEQKAADLINRGNGLASPPPVAVVPGESPTPNTDEQNYVGSMHARAARINL